MNNDKNFVVSLLTKTWVRDSHGLYDYESSQTKNLNAVLADNVLIARKKNEIKTIPTKEELKEDEFLLEVKYEKRNRLTLIIHLVDKYTLENRIYTGIQPTEKNIVDLSNKIWYVLSPDEKSASASNQTVTNTNDDYYLCQNDIIKLGRVKYALNEINIVNRQNIDVIMAPLAEHTTGYNIYDLNMNSPPVFDFIFLAKGPEGENEENICKICYCPNNEANNPLVHMCNCTGGIRFAHYNCIKKWMETKLIIKENEKKTVKSYNIKSFNCEICKMPYPFRFKLYNRLEIFDLIDIVRPENSDYIILESLNQMKENCNIKSIHVIQLTNDTITIGRGHESDVRINDISVSRTHALLKYNSSTGQLLLKDLKSKFGTLILIKEPVLIKEKKIHLQIGRTYIEASLMPMGEFEKLKKERKSKNHQTQLQSNGSNIPMDLNNKPSLFLNQGSSNSLNDNNSNNNNQTQDPKSQDVNKYL